MKENLEEVIREYINEVDSNFIADYGPELVSVFECLSFKEFSKLKIVYEFGGEGQGDTCGGVVSFTDGDSTRFLYYSSPYDSWTVASPEEAEYLEVYPRPKTVTAYCLKNGREIANDG